MENIKALIILGTLILYVYVENQNGTFGNYLLDKVKEHIEIAIDKFGDSLDDDSVVRFERV